MNNKKIVALLLAAMMSVSTASVAFADDTEIIKGYPDGDVWESKLYNAMLEAGDGLGGGSKDGKLTVDEAAAIETLTIDSLSLGALKGLEKCTGLKELTVTDSQVQDLSFLSGLTSLTSLTLSGNEIEDLSGLPNSLQTLDLSGNTDLADLSKLSGLSSLKTLNVSGTAVADVSKVPASVTDLDVSNTKVRDLTDLPAGLTSLKASGNNIEDMSKISGLTSLETLDLSDNLISVLTDLSGFSKLENLNLQGNSFSNIDSLESKLPASIKDNPDWKNSVFGTPSSETVDKTALKAAIANAQALLDATVASEDGKGVTSSEYWATQSEIDTFSAAIKAAQAVVDKEDASKEEVEAAVSALESAQSGFDRTQGSASFSSAPLTEAIKAAEALLASVEQAESADAVESGKQWVTASDYSTFEAAIQTAKDALANADDSGDITSAVSALEGARDTFRAAIRFGTKPTTPTPDPDPTPSTSREYSDYYGNEKWGELKDEIAKLIEDGKEGETIEFNATGLPYFPASVARALKGEDITLKVRKNGVTYTINGLEIGTVHKIWYDFEDIESELLTADGAEDETSSSTGDKENPSTGR